MTPITYEEHGFKTIIKNWTTIGPKLSGMRENKPFLLNGQLHINIEDSLNKIDDLEIFNNDGQTVKVESAIFDTANRIAAVITKGDELLLLYRMKKGREYYVFPGGHQASNETPVEAVKREILEELGLNVEGEDYEIIYEVGLPEGGNEIFYWVNNIENFDSLFKESPDSTEDNITKPTFVNLEGALTLDLFPMDIIHTLISKKKDD